MSSAQRVNAERPDQRRDGYVPIVVSDVDKTNQFADTATLRRLRHERDRSADDFVQAADLVVRNCVVFSCFSYFQISRIQPAPPGLSEADARIVQQSYPLFVRSVIASWFGAAAHCEPNPNTAAHQSYYLVAILFQLLSLCFAREVPSPVFDAR